MPKFVVKTNNEWTGRKIKEVIYSETELLKKMIQRIQSKLKYFENKFGKFERDSLYGRIDDMELIEWEGEIETEKKLKEKLKSFEEITFEYK